MSAPLGWLAAFAACAAAGPAPQRPVPYLWASAATPAGWELVHEHVWRPRGARGGPAIEAVFKDEGTPGEWLAAEAEPTPAQRKAQRLSEVRAGAVEHRGPWALVELETVSQDGTRARTLDAALPAPSGFYAVSYFGREDEYARHKAEALAFIDSFRRLPPPLRAAELLVPGKFSVSFPTSPWTNVVGDVDVDARAIAPGSPGGAPPGMLSASALGEGSGAAARFMEQTCGGAAARQVRTRAGVWRVAEAVNAATLRIPERARSDGPRRSRCAVLETGGQAYGLWWYAPPSAYDWGLPAFDAALKSFAPAR